MPPRKSERQEVPSYTAVMLAPDSPLKQSVIEHAERSMAVRMKLLQDSLHHSEILLSRGSVYIGAIVQRPPADPDKPRRRDPDAVSYGQYLRAQCRMHATLRDIDRLRESAYHQAREAAFARTLTRVGPRYWTDLDQGQAPPPDNTATAPQAVADLVPDAQAAPEPQPELAAAPEPQPDAAAAPGPTLTNFYLQYGRDLMTRANVPRKAQVELIRKAKAQRWTLSRYKEATTQLIESTRAA